VMLLQAIRDGDPMADYFNSKAAKATERVAVETGKPLKPVYRGPAAPPNRFHIRPGYRWDAIDRGNKFESDLLKKLNHSGSMKEEEYRWSVSDM
jgi:pre-mRNA-splicing factor CWC26